MNGITATVSTLGLASAAIAAVTFEPPVLLGLDHGFGMQATLAFSDQIIAATLGIAPASTDSPAAGTTSVVVTTDGGKTYTTQRFPQGFGMPEWPAVFPG